MGVHCFIACSILLSTRKGAWIDDAMQQTSMCALGAFNSPKIDVKLKKGGGGAEGKTY